MTVSNLKIKSIFTGALLGAAIYCIAAYFILGHTAAIALPGSIANWAAENPARFPVMFMWELLVVQLLGIGILSATATYLILRVTSLNWFYLAIGFIASDVILSILSLLALPTLKYISVETLIGGSPHFIVMLLCVFVAAKLGSKTQSPSYTIPQIDRAS